MRDFLLDSAESDQAFRKSISRASLLSLRAIGALELVVPLLMLIAGLSVVPLQAAESRAWIPNVVFGVVGALTLGAAYSPVGKHWPRLCAAVSVWISAATIIASGLLLAGRIDFLEHYLLGYITLVMFGAAAAVPLRALHTLMLGIAIDAAFFAAVVWSSRDIVLRQHVFVFLISVLCAALTASVYRQRYRSYLDNVRALQTAERLREAQNRLLIADNAAVLGRVAAALSHELNSPIGVLTSAVQTLSRVARRLPTAQGTERQRLQAVLDQVSASGEQSARRLHEIVSRMQRFTNLDRAEIQSADLNALLNDVIALIGSERKSSVEIQADLAEIPHFLCRPQQMSAVFSNLMSNALDALDQRGRIAVSTRHNNSHIEIRFQDNGRGIPPEDLETLFDPAAFHVAGGRVKAGNWSMFSCRQIVREHGGDLEITSSPAGTMAIVKLPERSALIHEPASSAPTAGSPGSVA